MKRQKLEQIKKDQENQLKRRKNPESVEDFKHLHEELQVWKTRQIELTRNNNLLNDIEKAEIFQVILFREIELLQLIHSMRINFQRHKKNTEINNLLQFLGEPKKWLNSIKRINLVETPLTRKSKMYFNMYLHLGLALPTEKRLDVLLATKEEVQAKKDELSI